MFTPLDVDQAVNNPPFMDTDEMESDDDEDAYDLREVSSDVEMHPDDLLSDSGLVLVSYSFGLHSYLRKAGSRKSKRFLKHSSAPVKQMWRPIQ